MVAQVTKVDLAVPVWVSLTHVVLDVLVWHLLVDQGDLHGVARVALCDARGSVLDVEGAPRAHRHSAVGDANVFEHLKFLTECRRLPFHQFNICNDVLDDSVRDLGGGVSKVRLEHLDGEAVGEEHFILLVLFTAMTTFLFISLRLHD